MALVATNIYAAQSLSTGLRGNPVKTALNAATVAAQLHANILNGNAAPDGRAMVVVYYAVSQYSITAAQALALMDRNAKKLEMKPRSAPNGTAYFSSDVFPCIGGFLYTWLDYGTFSPAITLDVTLVEAPNT